MKGYLFNVDGIKYFTGADTQMDAEEQYFQEFGEYYDDRIIEINNIDEFIIKNEKVVYF